MGVFTDSTGELTNDFFVNQIDAGSEWKKSVVCDTSTECRDRRISKVKWTAFSVDLVFGPNSQLRAISEVYTSIYGGKKFLHDFVAVWNKVMNLVCFDLPEHVAT